MKDFNESFYLNEFSEFNNFFLLKQLKQNKKKISEKETSIATLITTLVTASLFTIMLVALITMQLAFADEIKKDTTIRTITKSRFSCEAKNGRFYVTNNETNKTIDSYITYPSSTTIHMASCDGNVAVGVIGDYFIYSNGVKIETKYVSYNSTNIQLVSSFNAAGAIMGDYFISYVDNQYDYEYVGISSNDPRQLITATIKAVGAIIGDYFIVANGNGIERKYIGLNRDSRINLVSNGYLIAAATGDYFYVYDGIEKKIKYKYIGYEGEVVTTKEVVSFFADNGRTYTYSLFTHSFK